MSTLLLFSDTPEEVSDPILDGFEPPCGCWDLNSGPLEEQSVLLTTEPSLQPLPVFMIVVLVQIALSLFNLNLIRLVLELS